MHIDETPERFAYKSLYVFQLLSSVKDSMCDLISGSGLSQLLPHSSQSLILSERRIDGTLSFSNYGSADKGSATDKFALSFIGDGPVVLAFSDSLGLK